MERIYRPDDLQAALPARADDSFKGTYGKVLVAAGSKNMCGAAYFAAKAAYRTGAGLVYIYTQECNRVILQQLIPEAVLITYEKENWSRESLEAALEGKNALVAGPGLGLGEVQEKILETVLCADALPRVLDADALNLLARSPRLWNLAKKPFIITPHIGEMSRLTGLSAGEIKADAAGTAEKFSKEHGVVTVLKDARTVVSDGRDSYFSCAGNHGMATGGSGDVLCGIIGGLLAQKMSLLDAANLGVYIHGLAGDAAREERGAYSMMATDILEHILVFHGRTR